MVDLKSIRNQYQGYHKRLDRSKAIRDAVRNYLETSPHHVRSTPSGTQIYMKGLRVLVSPHGHSFSIEHYTGDTRKKFHRISNWETSFSYIDTLEIQGNLLVINGTAAFSVL